MSETPRPFLNLENYRQHAGKTREELKELRRGTRPPITAAPAAAPAGGMLSPKSAFSLFEPIPGNEKKTVKKLVKEFFSPKKKTEPAPAPARPSTPAKKPAAPARPAENKKEKKQNEPIRKSNDRTGKKAIDRIHKGRT